MHLAKTQRRPAGKGRCPGHHRRRRCRL